jgi:hypothetical protein
MRPMDQEKEARNLASCLTEEAFKSLEFDAQQHLVPRSLYERRAKLAVGQTCWVILSLEKPYQVEVVELEEGRDEHYRVRGVDVRSKGRGELVWSDHIFLTQIEAIAEWQGRLNEAGAYWQGILEQACEYVTEQQGKEPVQADLPSPEHTSLRGVARRRVRGYQG